MNYHRNVNDTRVWRYFVVKWPSLFRTTSIFRGVMPCFHPYRDSPDMISSERRGNSTDT